MCKKYTKKQLDTEDHSEKIRIQRMKKQNKQLQWSLVTEFPELEDRGSMK